MTRRVIVIGAGIVGACTALELVRRGHAVTILDPGQPGGPHAASYGNGSWISPASTIPMSMPGLWKKVPGLLLDTHGPLVIRWKDLPRLAPWLLRFLAAGASVEKVANTVRILSDLLRDGPSRHLRVAQDIGAPELVRQSGLIYAYTDHESLAKDDLAWRLRKENGLQYERIEGERLQALIPALDRRYQIGLLVPSGAHSPDTGAYVARIVSQACKLGAVFRQERASGFRFDKGRLQGVDTPSGALACDAAVVAAGIWSRPLAKTLGDRIPLISERGYHVTIASPAAAPAIPLMPCDGRMANTLMTDGLRCSGQVELAAVDAPADWRRADILVEHARRTYPALSNGELTVSKWMGHRPSTPDGLPVIGLSSRSSDVVYAFGHGHMGLCAGPATAELVALMIVEPDGPSNPSQFSPRRFGKLF
ncbi:FAD-binding oxidoreductase [Shinella sp. S4-D37]|uniref:NAD(P)/FAD-dependent oxidoreductase n=1 Tax=Shinella sp. S4-D37 TaxID=3161999 RepID=UPI00346669F2